MLTTSLNTLFAILRKKGLNAEDAQHFLQLELHYLGSRDRAQIRYFISENNMNEQEATHELLSLKKQRLYDELMSGHYDRRLAFY